MSYELCNRFEEMRMRAVQNLRCVCDVHDCVPVTRISQIERISSQESFICEISAIAYKVKNLRESPDDILSLFH